MKVLVTGGAGFIGSNLVKSLLERGDEVVVVDDLSSGKEENLPKNENLKFYKKSILDKDIEKLFDDVNVVFHLAALPRVQFSIKYPERTHEVNVNGTLNLLNICRKKEIKRFVFSSSSSVYGDQDILPLKEDMNSNPMSPYALHKLIGEYYCKLYHKLYGLETVSLRYFNVYGPGQDPEGEYAVLIPKFIKLISNNESPTINGDGEQTRDFSFISDVVNANIKSALSTNEKIFGEAFNIGSGKNVSVNKVTNEILKLTNNNIKIKYGPSVVEPKDTLADISKAENLLGWKPNVNFEEGLKRTIEAFK